MHVLAEMKVGAISFRIKFCKNRNEKKTILPSITQRMKNRFPFKKNLVVLIAREIRLFCSNWIVIKKNLHPPGGRRALWKFRHYLFCLKALLQATISLNCNMKSNRFVREFRITSNLQSVSRRWSPLQFAENLNALSVADVPCFVQLTMADPAEARQCWKLQRENSHGLEYLNHCLFWCSSELINLCCILKEFR